MKKLMKTFLFFSLFLGLKSIVAQNDFIIKISCFSNGETVAIEDLIKYPSITLINKNSKVDTKLLSYNCVFLNSNKNLYPSGIASIANNSLKLNEKSISLISALKPGDNFQITNIVIEVTEKRTKSKESKEIPAITINIGQTSSKPCGEKKVTATPSVPPPLPVIKVEYSGRLLMGSDHNIPLTNQKVILQDHTEKELQTSITNNTGDFAFKNLNANESYKINVSVDDDSKIKDGQLYAAKPDGTVIRSFNKTNKGFIYDLLPPELHVLVKENEEDTELKIKKFSESKAIELTVIEDIYYAFNSADIETESNSKLDKIILSMQQNKALKLSIHGHTDSKGDDGYNMILSEKRAQNVLDYFLSKGIGKERLQSKGLGETEIINRCKNGIDCFEEEHQLNRRTEFKFTK